MNRDRCIILVPFGSFIAPECERALDELECRGYPVNRVRGYANIDLGRNQMATDALAAGFEETFWIDADVSFHPDCVERLRGLNLPISCGIYARKNARALAVKTMPGENELSLGEGAGLTEIYYGATGFMHVRREVYETVQRQLALPVCNDRFGRPLVPFFQPMVRTLDGGGYWYLADDYSFCERVRQCGFKIVADPSIRLWHIGDYHYGWEEAGLDRQRFDSFLIKIPDAPKKL